MARKTRRRSKEVEESEPKTRRGRRSAPSAFVLPTERRTPVSDPWAYAYLLTGEMKIGKTSFAIEGCEELVFQFDKPQISYSIREVIIEQWGDWKKALAALEERAKSGDFPYTRLVFDGVLEWYSMCQLSTCKHFAIEHPSEEGYARAWHHLRDEFTDTINRILRLQVSANCGVVFIAHAEWKESPIRGGEKIEKLVPNLAGTCNEIVTGKVDGWFCYDYDGEDRILIVRGNQAISAGHKIDGRFVTPDGRSINEIYAGTSPIDAMNNFVAAFHNEWEWATFDEWKAANRVQPRKARGRRSRRRSVAND